MEDLREKIEEYVDANYPEWSNNEKFLTNVETLCEEESIYLDDVDDEEAIENLIEESVLGSINDYEEGLTDF